MAGMLEYVRKCGHLGFDELPFNEIDNLKDKVERQQAEIDRGTGASPAWMSFAETLVFLRKLVEEYAGFVRIGLQASLAVGIQRTCQRLVGVIAEDANR